MKKLLSVLLIAMLVLAGCSNKPADETDNTTDVERPYYVRAEDEITGTITVYTTMEETQQEALKALWEKYYPNAKIEIQADSVGTLATRIRSDGTSDADVIIGGLFAADGDQYHDILQPYTAQNDKEQNYHDESGYYTFFDVQIMSLIVNPKLRDELGIEIKGYADLLDPKLDGKIILAAPDASSSGWRQLQTMLATMGDSFDDDKGWDYIEQLMKLSYSSTSSKDVYNLVVNGEYVVGLTWESIVDALIKDGAPVENVYMEEGNTAMASGGAIVKGAPNQAAAEAMMDLLASTEFHDLRAEKSSGRSANGLAELSGLPEETSMDLKDLDFDYLAENKDAMIDKWNTLWSETH